MKIKECVFMHKDLNHLCKMVKCPVTYDPKVKCQGKAYINLATDYIRVKGELDFFNEGANSAVKINQ